MSKPICSTSGCGKPSRCRGLCQTCYGRLYRSGGMQPTLPIGVHSLAQVDVEARTAVCAICGPVKIRLRGGGRSHECMTLRRKYLADRKKNGPVTPETRRRWKYKISGEQYASMVEAQGGRCAICQRPDELKVDHDHACCAGTSTCGECIRGLLCDWCNRGLGIFRDNPTALIEAAGYLQRFSAGSNS